MQGGQELQQISDDTVDLRLYHRRTCRALMFLPWRVVSGQVHPQSSSASGQGAARLSAALRASRIVKDVSRIVLDRLRSRRHCHILVARVE